MIEISNIQAVNKGNLLCTCDITIKPWGEQTLHEVKVFQKGLNRWIGMPSREFTNREGEKKYIDLITFPERVVKRLRDQLMKAVDEYLAQNPDMTPEDVIQPTVDDGIPF